MAKKLSMASSWIWMDTANPGNSETMVERGNLWLNTDTGAIYMCTDATSGAQVWKLFTVGN